MQNARVDELFLMKGKIFTPLIESAVEFPNSLNSYCNISRFDIQKLSAFLPKQNESQQMEKTSYGYFSTVAFNLVGSILEIFE